MDCHKIQAVFTFLADPYPRALDFTVFSREHNIRINRNHTSAKIKYVLFFFCTTFFPKLVSCTGFSSKWGFRPVTWLQTKLISPYPWEVFMFHLKCTFSVQFVDQQIQVFRLWCSRTWSRPRWFPQFLLCKTRIMWSPVSLEYIIACESVLRGSIKYLWGN